jgi:MFS family permease
MMKLLPLFIFWGLWFLSFSTRTIFSPILPLILTTLILQATVSLAFFPAGLAAISKLTPLSERSMAIGVTVSIGMIFGMGLTPFILGLIADHQSFQVGILWLVGILTTISSLGVRLLGKE